MKKLQYSVITIAILASLFSACRPTEDDVTDTPLINVGNNVSVPHFRTIKEFFQVMGEESQHYTLDASTGGVITCDDGTRFVFPPNAFVRPNGMLYSGNITLEIKEITKVSEMILSNKPTLSNGIPLESGGEFYLSAVANGEELQLAPGAEYQVLIPTNNALSGMQVFNGVPELDGQVNWVEDIVPDTAQGGALGANWVQSYAGGGTAPWDYVMNCDSTHWTNCDAFGSNLGYPSYITVNAHIDNPIDNENTLIFVNFTGHKTLWPLTNLGNNTYFSDHVYGLPVTLVAICAKDDKIYTDVQTLTLADGQNYTLHLTETTHQAFKQTMQTLD